MTADGPRGNMFSQNLKFFRKLSGESQEALAYALGVAGKSTVSQWETGDRFPEDQRVIKAIADHYNITVEDLLYKDYSLTATFNPPTGITEIQEASEKLLIVANSDSAFDSEAFKKAYELDVRLYKEGCADGDSDAYYTDLQNCFDYYDKAIEEGIPEAIINELRWLFFLEQIQVHETMIMNIADKIEGDSLTQKDLKQASLSYGEENLSGPYNNDYEERREEVKELEDETKKLLQKLRKHGEWRDYLDYYIALKYSQGLVYNDFTKAENVAVGMDLLIYFATLGNPYAIDFIKVMKPQEQINS